MYHLASYEYVTSINLRWKEARTRESNFKGKWRMRWKELHNISVTGGGVSVAGGRGKREEGEKGSYTEGRFGSLSLLLQSNPNLARNTYGGDTGTLILS